MTRPRQIVAMGGGGFSMEPDNPRLGEPLRRPTYHRLVAEGRLTAGYGVDDGAALVFEGTELREAVASRSKAAAYRVELADGSVRETRLATRYLGG